MRAQLSTYIFLMALFVFHTISLSQTTIYTYDALNRLKKADYGNGNVIEFTYDEVGNRITHKVTGQTQTVATPTFNPAPGTYTSPQNVILSCATSGATIRYTTNGSDPTESSPAYTSPIPVNATTTIKARGYLIGWTPSSVATGVYTITGTVNFVDDFNRQAIGSNWRLDIPTGGSASIVNYPPDGKLQLFNPNASGTHTRAILITPNSVFSDVTVEFDFDNGAEQRQNNNTSIYLRYADDGNGYVVSIQEDNYQQPSRYNVALLRRAGGAEIQLAIKQATLLQPGRYQFSINGQNLRFRNVSGGTSIDLQATDSYSMPAGRIAFVVNEEITLFDNVNVTTPSTTRTLTVASSNPNSGVSITVSPTDNNGQGSGTTQFTRTYNNNTVVTLTAPSTAGGNNFQKWQRNGADYSTSLTTNVTMDANYTMTAVYASGCQVTSISIGQTVNGVLSTSDCRSPVRGSTYYADRYSFNATSGQQIAILLTSSAFDTYLYLIGPTGSVVTSNDDGGGGTNSRIPPSTGFYSLSSSGTYTVEVTSYHQNITGNYTLSLSGPTPCTYSISPTSRSHGSGAETGTVNVTAASGCNWTASSNASWITITSGSSGSGNGTVSYSVATNTNASSRTGTLTIAGQPFIITQAASVVTIFFDNMENGISGWAFNSPWAQTTTSSYSPTHSWTDSPGGYYNNNVNLSIWSPFINLSGQTTATLTFWHRFDLETNYDFGRVWITTNNGTSYTFLASFTGTQTSWMQTTISLNAFVGNPSIRITFQLFSDGSITRDGWYIDDVKITSGGSTSSLPRVASLSESSRLPKSFSLSDNYPNPFNPSTTIRYTIPTITESEHSVPEPNAEGKSNESCECKSQSVHATLRVFNVLGQLVRVLVDEDQKPGFYEVQWDGKNDNGQRVGSGIYFYTIVAGDFKATKRMLMLQ